MEITTDTVKKIKQLKKNAQKMQKKFRKQLPQMKPEIFSCINNNLQIIIKIIEEIENEIQLIELAQNPRITFYRSQTLIA